jgi:Fe-S oxidoreductase
VAARRPEVEMRRPAAADLPRRKAERRMVKLSLSVCVHCAICADSCFKFTNSGRDPSYSPSYKAINSIGLVHRKRAKLSPAEWEEAKDLAWNKCVLCMRCYCPIGISIPSLIAKARSACRDHGYYRTWAAGIGGGPPRAPADGKGKP